MASAMTELDVVNRALTKLGAQEITSLDASSKSARVMKGIVDPVRDKFLRVGVWNHSIERAVLAKDTTDPAWGFSSRFRLPSDFIKLVTVESGDSTTLNTPAEGIEPFPIRFRIEGGFILCDEDSSLRIRYVMRLEDMSRYDSEMIEALATLYAVESCKAITGDLNFKRDLKEEYRLQLVEARKSDGWEDGAQDFPEDTYILARR